MTMPRRVAGGVRPVDRREFLACCAGALAVIGLGGCAALVTRTVYPVNGRLELPLTLYPELLERGGQLRLRPEGHSEEIYVLALPDSGFAALSPVCTHLGCIVDIEGERLVCPCHGSTYDRSGAVLQGPAELALRRYPSRLGEDGVLIIDLRSQA